MYMFTGKCVFGHIIVRNACSGTNVKAFIIGQQGVNTQCMSRRSSLSHNSISRLAGLPSTPIMLCQLPQYL